ncbi:hypothetical protein BC829DRAFT_432531, partial [Chytridium lagenaria]
MDEDDDQSAKGGDEAPAEPVNVDEGMQPDPTVTPWPRILNKLYPGQVSHLHRSQKERINDVVQEFLAEYDGENINRFKTYSGAAKKKMTWGIPANLLEPFGPWIEAKLDAMVTADEFSSRPSYKKSNASDTKIYDGARKVQRRSAKVSAKTSPAPAENPEEPSDGLLAWTDLIRGAFPDFTKVSARMSQWEHETGEIRAFSAFGPVKRETLGIPRSLHEKFAQHFASKFYWNGRWLEAPVGSAINNRPVGEGSSERGDESDAREDHRDVDAALRKTIKPVGTIRSTLSEITHEQINAAIAAKLANVATRTIPRPAEHALKTWGEVVQPKHAKFLEMHAKNSVLLVRMRNAIRTFLLHRAPSVGLEYMQCLAAPEGKGRKTYAIPEPLQAEFETWFALQCIDGFRKPENGLILMPVPQQSEEMDMDDGFVPGTGEVGAAVAADGQGATERVMVEDEENGG